MFLAARFFTLDSLYEPQPFTATAGLGAGSGTRIAPFLAPTDTIGALRAPDGDVLLASDGDALLAEGERFSGSASAPGSGDFYVHAVHERGGFLSNVVTSGAWQSEKVPVSVAPSAGTTSGARPTPSLTRGHTAASQTRIGAGTAAAPELDRSVHRTVATGIATGTRLAPTSSGLGEPIQVSAETVAANGVRPTPSLSRGYALGVTTRTAAGKQLSPLQDRGVQQTAATGTATGRRLLPALDQSVRRTSAVKT